jgi:hypothetical protein
VQEIAPTWRVAHGVGEPVIHGLETGRVEVVEPRDLNRRRLESEDAETVVAGMAGDVDQDVDTVVANPLGDLVVGRALHHARRDGSHPRECRWRLRCVEVGVHVEAPAVVAAEHGLDERRQRGMAIRRHIADAQATLRLGRALGGHVACGGQPLETLGVGPMEGEHFAGRVPRRQLGECEEVGIRDGGIRQCMARTVVRRERVLEPALVFVEVAQIVEDLHGVRGDPSSRLELGHRVIDIALALEHVAEVHAGADRVGSERKGTPIRVDRIVRAREVGKRRSKIGPRRGVARRTRNGVLQVAKSRIGPPARERISAEPRPDRGSGRRARRERRQCRYRGCPVACCPGGVGLRDRSGDRSALLGINRGC